MGASGSKSSSPNDVKLIFAEGKTPHVTFSTRFAGEAYQRSVDAAALFMAMGLTKYSPNTDCEQKEGDEQKGASNWLRSFRDNGLKRSKETRGFVVQLQEDTKRERSDMQ
eukprot:6943519-Prymnesium_polylepis.1